MVVVTICYRTSSWFLQVNVNSHFIITQSAFLRIRFRKLGILIDYLQFPLE